MNVILLVDCALNTLVRFDPDRPAVGKWVFRAQLSYSVTAGATMLNFAHMGLTYWTCSV